MKTGQEEIASFVTRGIAVRFKFLAPVNTSLPSFRPWAGIQPTRVCAARESFQPKDLGWLDTGSRPVW